MKLSFWTLGTPDWSNVQVVDAARRFGFDGVDLRCAAGRNVSVQSTPEEIAELRRLFADNGVEISSILAYNQRGNAEDVDWVEVQDDIARHIDLAQRLGTKAMRVNAAEPAAGSSWDQYLQGFAFALTGALTANDSVVLNMQNHPGAPNIAQIGRLVSMVHSPLFGSGFSPDHCVDMGEDVLASAETLAPVVKQLHLADRSHDGRGTTTKMRACLPGEGFVPNREVIDLLQRHGYDGYVSFKWEKPTYPDLPDAEIALPHFVKWMRGEPSAKT
jgi:sugar phosphate isomerase/epimerase